MFNASTGQTLTCTSQRHDSRSAAIGPNSFFSSHYRHIPSRSFYLGLCQQSQTPHSLFNATFSPVHLSSFRCSCPYQRNLLHVTVDDILSILSRLYSSLLERLFRKVTPHILRIIVCLALSNLLRSSLFIGQVSLSLYHKPWHFWHSCYKSSLSAYELIELIINIGASSLNFFQPQRTQVLEASSCQQVIAN